MPASVDIIIVNFNGRVLLEKCLSSIAKMNYSQFNVYVIDNGSSDGSVEFVKTHFPQFNFVSLGANLGFSRANNYGIKLCRGEFVFFLNNDVIVKPDTLEKLVEGLRDPEVAIVVPKMYDFEGLVNSAGGVCDYYGFAFNKGIGERDREEYNHETIVPYGCCGAALVRRRVLEEVGVFDWRYFMYHEDVDLSWRIRLCAYKILYYPSSVVFHKYMASIGKDRTRIISLWEKNRVRTLLKNYELGTLITVLPTLLILKILHTIYALVHKDIREITGLAAAYLWNLHYIRDTLQERHKIQKSRRVPDSYIRRLMIPYSIELRLGLGKIRHPIARHQAVPVRYTQRLFDDIA